MQLLLDVWREACRHIEIDQSLDRIARLVATRLPADLLIVRRLDADRARLETVSVGICRPDAVTPTHTRTEIPPGDFPRVLEWARGQVPLRGRTGSGDRLLNLLAPPDMAGDWIAGPLVSEEGAIGVLLLLAVPPRAFTAAHEKIVRPLLEPLAVALANDLRLHELVRLREALEADKRALLSRLDRQEVSEAVVGTETGLRSVTQRIEQVAPTDAPVLIFGETGTGKEVVARAVHMQSRRHAGPMVRVNCGALTPGLVDSELFGHERGSFTGAVATRHGWFERADGGTLFLDEIGELSLDAQVRLLRILQDGTFERVGGTRPLTVDVRVVAATHRDLQEMVSARQFREDLWYRIGVFPIRLPPLRERLEDVPAMAAHFARRAGNRLGGAALVPSARDLELMLAYSWPGNVRELAAVIERAAILGGGRELRIAAALGGTQNAARATAANGEPTLRATATDTIEPLDTAMRHHIEAALRVTGGRIEGSRGAAAKLGINPHTLRARMRKLGVEWSQFRRGLL